MRINGKKIVRIETLGSWYANNYVNVWLDDGSLCRMHADTILRMVNEFSFKKVKSRKYFHLEEPALGSV